MLIRLQRSHNVKTAVLGSAICAPPAESVMITELEEILSLDETILKTGFPRVGSKYFSEDNQEQFKTSVGVAVNSDSIIMEQSSASQARKQFKGKSIGESFLSTFT